MWLNTSGDTEASSGDVVKLMFNITNVLQESGLYEYSLIADFDDPLPIINIGSGNENFENDLIANPSTPISFNSGENQTDSSEYNLWNEDLTSFDSSYMSHGYLPDGFSSTWSMNTLNMYNQFPTSTITEDWINWNLNYNSDSTDSSFING